MTRARARLGAALAIAVLLVVGGLHGRGTPTTPQRALEWAIYITPEPFVGPADDRQRLAIASFLRLIPPPRVVLVGAGTGYARVAAEFGLGVAAGLDMNSAQMPLAGSLIDVARRGGRAVNVIVNSDVLLTQSFADAIVRLEAHLPGAWFFTGARTDVEALPASLRPDDPRYTDAALVQHARETGVLHTAGGNDYFAWNEAGGAPLVAGHVPPFIRGKSKFDNWIVHEAIAGGHRAVVDGTGAVTVVHVRHAYRTTTGKVVAGARGTNSSTFWQSGKDTNWQIYHNVHLAIREGSYTNQDGTALAAPLKLVECLDRSPRVCIVRRARPGICHCEHAPYALATQTDPKVMKVTSRRGTRTDVRVCGSVSKDAHRYDVAAVPRPGSPPGLPFTLDQLLLAAPRDGHVVVTGMSYNYRLMAMNFVCNLRRLGLYGQLVVAAWDEEMYEYGFRMGLPVFLYRPRETYRPGDDMRYGSSAFRRVTKLKSELVLAIVERGIDVTWCDTDVVWFANLLPRFAAMPADIVVQSNAPTGEAAANGALRINSGLYRVRSTPASVEALRAIVEHARASRLTEQPSFYHVLCGGKEGARRVGNAGCVYHSTSNGTLAVAFLDRRLYPAGAFGAHWDDPRPHTTLVALHNNWITGIDNKMARLREHRLWFYNESIEVCSYAARPAFA